MKISKNNNFKGLLGKVHFAGSQTCLAYCKPISKYNLKTNKWEKANSNNIGKSFSIVKYNSEFGKKCDTSSSFEYFILLEGMRVENYSKQRNIKWY